MKLKEYQKRVEDTWIPNEHDFIRILCGLIGETGEVFEKIKKYHRGDFDLKFLQKALKKEIGDKMYYSAKLCNWYGLSLEDILQDNFNKLKKRKEEGTLKGSGDDR